MTGAESPCADASSTSSPSFENRSVSSACVILARGTGLSFADRCWDRLLAGLAGFATCLTRVIQSGRLSHYLTLSFLTAGLVILATLAAKRPVLAVDFTAPLPLWVIAGFMLSLWMAVNGELPPAPFVEQVTENFGVRFTSRVSPTRSFKTGLYPR